MRIFTAFFLGTFLFSFLLFPALSLAVSEGDKANGIDLMVDFPSNPENIPVQDSENENRKGAIYIMEQYVQRAFVFGAGLVSVVAVLWIIVGGYEIMFSGAGSGEISSGKEKITKAILGIVLVFLSALILHTINPGFFAW